jgi:hypothetical protein
MWHLSRLKLALVTGPQRMHSDSGSLVSLVDTRSLKVFPATIEIINDDSLQIPISIFLVVRMGITTARISLLVSLRDLENGVV